MYFYYRLLVMERETDLTRLFFFHILANRRFHKEGRKQNLKASNTFQKLKIYILNDVDKPIWEQEFIHKPVI